MKWSLRIGQFAGIGVYIHSTFFLLLVWVAATHFSAERNFQENAGAAVSAIAFVLAIFACVLLHEFGHALMAKRFGIRTRDITLLPIGGLARLERIPRDPIQELWVAIAGPAVNVVIAAILVAWLVIWNSWESLSRLGVATGPFVMRMLAVNVMLVAFNALPAFPMDGGRVLRAILATQMDHARATQIAATVGKAMALLFGIVGLKFSPMLIFIAVFVWIGASQEASMVQMQSALAGMPVRRAMVTDFQTVGPSESLDRLLAMTLASRQRHFPVLDEGQIVGIVSQGDLMRAVSEGRLHESASAIMRRQFPTIDASEMLESGLSRLGESEAGVLPVTSHGQLAGLLTTENVGEFLRFQAALSTARRAPRDGRIT